MIQIQIWADFECPFCYLQTIVLGQLKANYPDDIEIVWKAFELNPIEEKTTPSVAYLQNLEIAKSELIVLQKNLTLLTPQFLTYTWLAQESVYFANTQGLSLRLARELFDAFFLRGSDISNEELVIEIDSQCGVEVQRLREALDYGVLTKHVMTDEQEFKTYGFQGLPAMLIGEKEFSPKSFLPVTRYKTLDELTELIPHELFSL